MERSGKWRHEPVMVQEVVTWLNINPGGVYVDATIGLGGHGKAILQRLSAGGMLVAMDWDGKSLELARENLKEFGSQVACSRANFKDMEEIVNQMEIFSVDGILMDLGVSSYQFEDAQRGFSFLRAGPLDMRMDEKLSVRAEDLLLRLSERELSQLFFTLGEERHARKIARAVVSARERTSLQSTVQLAQIIARAGRRKRGRAHPATRVFMALRMAVNSELENLSSGLVSAVKLLKPGGRLLVISFHSLEDRAVKIFFKSKKNNQEGFVLTKKPLKPTLAEQRGNPRSRSAKLRVFEKAA